MAKVTFRLARMRLWIICLTSFFFLLMYMSGVEEHVSVLAGVHSGSGWERMFGFFYILFYILMITVIPIILISIPISVLSHVWTKSSSSKA